MSRRGILDVFLINCQQALLIASTRGVRGAKESEAQIFSLSNWKDRVDINGDKEHDSGTDGWE